MALAFETNRTFAMTPRAPKEGDRQFWDKPAPLCDLADPVGEVFPIVKAWFHVPDCVHLNLSDVDVAEGEMFEAGMVAAVTLRKIQALRLLSRPGVETSLAAILSLISDVRSALGGMLQQPAGTQRGEADSKAVETLCSHLEAAARSLGQTLKDVPISVEIWLR